MIAGKLMAINVQSVFYSIRHIAEQVRGQGCVALENVCASYRFGVVGGGGDGACKTLR